MCWPRLNPQAQDKEGGHGLIGRLLPCIGEQFSFAQDVHLIDALCLLTASVGS